AILRSRAERSGRMPPDEILSEIAERVQSNIRELEGALTRVLAYADLRCEILTPNLVDAALADMVTHTSSVTTEQIISVVADQFGVEEDRLLSRDRSREVAYPRQIAMYLIREETSNSLPKIGEALGGRDHTTVMYGYEKIADQLEIDDALRRQVMALRERLYNH
ncbi:MAG: chromosomal replication initiator protein DnaA, partial [Anaerolineales bacterium]|nr:chromosomal replication initiator protein DnaA [Anaerolineales bacterium]